jgi:hypothetical protein
LFGQTAQIDSARLFEPYRQAQLPTPVNSYPFRYWDKNYFITYTADDTSPSTPAVVLYDREGRVAREAIVSFIEMYSTGIDDAAINKAGDLVVSGGTEDQAGVIGNFIASISKDGRVSRMIRTSPFLPIYVCSADDGTVWSYGIERNAQGRGVQTSLRLRQYSFDKGELRAMLDVSSLNSDGWKLTEGRYPGEISLRCTSHRVGLLNGVSSELAEFDLATNKLKVSKVEPLPPPEEVQISGFALTESGDVFMSLHDHSTMPSRSGLFKLSFDSPGAGKWVPLIDTVGPFLHGAKVGQLLGTDGTDLIYTRDLDGTTYWSKFTK